LSLGEEFHHNRINVISSQIFEVSLALDHRWTVERLEHTVMTLAAEKKIGLKPLVTHVFGADEAGDAFRLLDESPGEAVQVVLEF
jgi:threonine dehydrogenase-like Zn-dependent dehydrogenase